MPDDWVSLSEQKWINLSKRYRNEPTVYTDLTDQDIFLSKKELRRAQFGRELALPVPNSFLSSFIFAFVIQTWVIL